MMVRARADRQFPAARGALLRRLVPSVLLGLLSTGLFLALSGTSTAAQGTVELPVAFQVQNTDTSQAPCPPGSVASDGATYTVRGHISGPAAALASGKAHAITVYLFGYEAGEWNWDPHSDYCDDC